MIFFLLQRGLHEATTFISKLGKETALTARHSVDAEGRRDRELRKRRAAVGSDAEKTHDAEGALQRIKQGVMR